MEELLMSAGLSTPQSKVYLYLLEHGSATPPAIAKATSLTRSNAYKVLESLAELGLAREIEAGKKIAYFAEDPTALASIIAEERNRVLALENNVNQALQELRNKYRRHASTTQLKVLKGKSAMIKAYENQATNAKTIHFVKARADIPFLGYEVMDKLRNLPAKYGARRFGITPDAPEAPLDQKIDTRTNLQRTWIPAQSYTAPVEWSCSGDTLLIHIFENEGRVIQIEDTSVAEAFRQIWSLIDQARRNDPAYKAISPHAKRQH